MLCTPLERKGGQKNEKVKLWGLRVQFIVMAAAKKIQAAAEIAHGVYYPETNLRHSSCCHSHKIGDKVKYEEPQSHQPPVQSSERGSHHSKWPNILMGFSQPKEPVDFHSGPPVTFM